MPETVSLEIAWSRLINICDEAATALVRTSFSSAVRDFHDYACALFDARERMIAQSNHTTPGLLGILPHTVRSFCRHIEPETLAPGDVIITNDPWIATGHLIDITLMTPIFVGGTVVGYASCSVHHLDVGGRLATIESRDIFEEGLKIPICKLYKAGIENSDVFEFIRHNVRMSDKVIGDIRAQVAANHICALRVADFMEEFSLKTLDEIGSEIVDRTEAAFRNEIAKLPDGEYRHSLTIDRVADDEEPLEIVCCIKIAGDSIDVDYEGTSKQVRKAINSPLTMTTSYTYFPFKAALLPHEPNNQGCLEPIRVAAPEASILNAKWPAATWGRTIVVHYLPEVIMGALAHVIPDRVIASGGASPLWYQNISGSRRDGSQFFAITAHHGGLGARPMSDGINCLSFPSNVANVPVEISEKDAPILYYRKELAIDSGGPGEMRGGLGQDVSFGVIDGPAGPMDQVTIGVRGGRHDFSVPGICGGGDASSARILLNGEDIRSGRQYHLRPGDRLDFSISGGGGYGDPKKRDRGKVNEDVRLGYVSPEQARSVYGWISDESGSGGNVGDSKVGDSKA